MSGRGLWSGRNGAPCVVIIGAPRSGTTSIARWLEDLGVAVGIKDSFYLMDDDAGLRGKTHLSTHGTPGYMDLFNGLTDPTLECTAGYLYQRRALQFFSEWDEPPHFVAILREPVERLRSVHQYFTGNLGLLPSDLSFEDFARMQFTHSVPLPDKTVAEALRQGRYAEHLRPWADTFGTEKLSLISFSDLEYRPQGVVTQIMGLLAVEPDHRLDSYNFSAKNQSHFAGPAALTWTTGLARKLMPDSRLRRNAGEVLRRVQAKRTGRSEAARLEGTVYQQLADYYREANEDLETEFNFRVHSWADIPKQSN